ncbi:PepSY domain-containing protein [Bosea psychrotolerans]|uniref:YpeB-like protein with putative protease inhibitory function n=1 Tax=Bosea psychrotolerans TaxID=1871628 RepID=A0A2S4MQJ3_9HYPH|nr:PepSY domain-containing protein [Bosea psychrotolerans]POR57022.1 YpeB-like protein with putative protease inhibitory function [Bosea psychrotolerans]
MPLYRAASAWALAGTFMLQAGIAAAQPAAPNQPGEPGISMTEARRIAIDNGMVRIEEVELEDCLWQLNGSDNLGADIEIDLRASDGKVVKVERNDPLSAAAPH